MVTEQLPDRATLRAIEHFNAAFNDHDVDAVMAAMTDDCVFENTSPFPDGERITGQADVRAFWTEFFDRSPAAYFAAVAIENGCEWITTDRDYSRFPSLRWRHPLE